VCVIGGVVIGLSWPGTETDSSNYFGSSTEQETGSVAGVVVGAIIGAVGNAMLMVALIAYGVRFGMESVNPKE
jgi:hypothetical protein